MLRTAAPFLVLLAALPAAAQQAPRPGPGEAVVVSATAGDAACYLTLRDSAGRQANWPASFELCEEGDAGVRPGRRYAFRWEAGNILHPSCQGNMDCGRSLRVMLAVEARPLAR